MSTFFQQIAKMLGQGNSLSLNIIVKNDSMTVGVVPGVNSDNKMPMLTISGTAQEMDEGFFGKIQAPVSAAIGLVTNAQEFEKEAKKIADDIKTKATPKKEETVKKETAKKPDKKQDKKAEKKVAVPKKAGKGNAEKPDNNPDNTSEVTNATEETTPAGPVAEQKELFT